MNLTEEEILEFKQEALELLDIAESALLEIGKGAELSGYYDSIFRALHSVKGAAGVINMDTLKDHVHGLETFFSELKGRDKLEADEVDRLLEGCDKARELLGAAGDMQVDEAGSSANSSSESIQEKVDPAVLEFIAETREMLVRLNHLVGEIENEGNNQDRISALYRDVHTIKGSALLFGLQAIGDLGHVIESHLEYYRRTVSNLPPNTLDMLFKSLDMFEKMVDAVERNKLHLLENEAQHIKDYFAKEPQEGEAVIEVKDEPPVSTPEPVSTPVPTPAAQNAPKMPEIKSEAQTSLRISVGILDRLMTLMGEMVLVRNQVIQYSNNNDDLEFINLSQRLDVVTSEMQAEVMKTRMQPIGSILTKFQRVVRDLSKSLNKKIDISFFGNETELDKALLEAVKDPLMHIVRNACDHGLEQAHERTAMGKNEEGNIRIRSFHEGGQVIIEISDDGRGLNKDAIVKKAIDRQLVTAEKALQLSDKEVFNFIFHPGFSTAAAVTSVSGRGVGMDVVRKNIEKIGGHVDISSTMGKGSTIRLKIPLTLAIVPAMIIRSGCQSYAIPQVKLVELVRVETGNNSQQIEYIQGRPVYRLRGSLLPIINLSKALGQDQNNELSDVTNIVVVNADVVTFGLVVDEVLDTADIVVKPLIPLLKSLEVYSGATVLGDGSISLILDVLGIAMSQSLTTGQLEDNTGKNSKAKSKHETGHSNNEFLVVELSNGQKHALPLAIVNRMEEIPVHKIEKSGELNVVQYRDKILPLLDLSHAMNLNGKTRDENEKAKVIVTRYGDKQVGLEVKEILDVITVNSDIDSSFSDRKSILGNIVHSGEIIAVVDSFNILSGASFFDVDDRVSDTAKLSAGTNKKILFAEDTEFFRRHVSRLLIDAGYDVLTAENGKQALSILQATPNPSEEFSMVLSDIEMPEMNGMELAKAIKADPRLNSMKLVALTTRYSEKLQQEGIEAGFSSYLEKLNPSVLLTELKKYLQAA